MFIEELKCMWQNLESVDIRIIQHSDSQTLISGSFTFLNYLRPQRAFFCIGCIKYIEKNLVPYIHEAGKGHFLITFLDNYGYSLLLH